MVSHLYLAVGYDRDPHPLHTDSRSTSYINKVFQHLLLWLLVIRMQPHTDMLGLTHSGGSRTFTWVLT
jgi:hypothetical protein